MSEWRVDEVVQIDPNSDDTFGGCYMTITEPKPWGAQGYVQIPGGGQAYYRCKTENMHHIGFAEWALGLEDKA